MLSPGDRAVCERDPALPGLRVLLDEDALLELLGVRYRDSDVSSLRTVYVRYKPGTSCIVGAEAVWRGQRRALYARAVTPANAHKIPVRHGAIASPNDDLPSVSLPELALAIHPFPHDQELSAVRRLGDPDEKERLLARLLPAGAEVARATLTPLRYKPERRFVARVDAPGTPPVVLRCYSDADFAPSLGCAAAVAAAAPAVARGPIAIHGRRRAAAWPWVDGLPLDAALRRDDAGASARSAARALASLHTSAPADQLPLLDPAAAAAEAARGLGTLLPSLAGDAGAIAARAAEAIGGTSAPRVAHGDFSPDQVIITDGAAVLLDFDRAGLADPHLDLGLLAARLRMEAAASAGAIIRWFLAGYEEAGGTVRPAMLAAYTAVGLLLRAPEPFRGRAADWPERCAAAIRMAEEELGCARSLA